MRPDAEGVGENSRIDIMEMLKSEIARQKPGSIVEANRIADEVSRGHNSTAQSDLGGLSPDQAFTLTRPDWLGRSVTLNDSLQLSELSDAPMFRNARRLLLAISAQGFIKTTATGAFNRKFAMQMLDEFDFPTDVKESILAGCKVVNQTDVPLLDTLRHLLPMAGLLILRTGELRVPKNAVGTLDDLAAGKLYALLFRTLIKKFNIAAMDGRPDAPLVQDKIGFSFYQLHRLPDDWIDVADVASTLFLPAVRDRLPELSAYTRGPCIEFAVWRILQPLALFGLIVYAPTSELAPVERFRKTSLFDRFIQFHLPSTPDPAPYAGA